MNFSKTALGALAYTLVTFPLAVVWHVVLFGDKYEVFGYFEGEPNFALGLLTIVLQGVILSALYPRVGLSGHGMWRGFKFAMITGAFFWTSHVLAFVAKRVVIDAPAFVLMETFYLLLQFGIFGLLIGRIYSGQRKFG